MLDISCFCWHRLQTDTKSYAYRWKHVWMYNMSRDNIHPVKIRTGFMCFIPFTLISQGVPLWVKGSDLVCFSFPASQTCIQNILICLVTVFISLMFFTCYIWSEPYKICSCHKILDWKVILLPTLIMDRLFQAFYVCSASSFFSVRICCLSLLFILTKTLWVWRGHFGLWGVFVDLYFSTIFKNFYGPSCQMNARFWVNHSQYLGALHLSVLRGDVWGIPLKSLKTPNPRHHNSLTPQQVMLLNASQC